MSFCDTCFRCPEGYAYQGVLFPRVGPELPDDFSSYRVTCHELLEAKLDTYFSSFDQAFHVFLKPVEGPASCPGFVPKKDPPLVEVERLTRFQRILDADIV